MNTVIATTNKTIRKAVVLLLILLLTDVTPRNKLPDFLD